MSEISPLMVKTLREKTGAGMMDCKKALNEVAGDLEAAVDWLRKKGLAAASKKAGRVAAEGLIAVASKGTTGAMVEINAETDFLARNTQFQSLCTGVVQVALSTNVETIDGLNQTAFQGTETVAEAITNAIAVIGENISARRLARFSVKNGVVASYVHSAIVPNLGKIGVLVALESEADAVILTELGKKIAMHVAAAAPQFLKVGDVDETSLARERAVLVEQAKASGRPDDVIQKMVEGRIRKYYEEVVLLEQIFVVDGKSKVSEIIEQTARAAGHAIQLVGFARFVLGDGIEKQETDFAAEVQAQAGLK